MTAESLRAEIAETRRKRRRTEAELNRIGMVLKRLSEHRDRLERGLETPTVGRGPDDGGTGGGAGSNGAGAEQDSGADVVSAFERLVRPDEDESIVERREALSFLDAPVFEVESADGRRDPRSFVDRPAFEDDPGNVTGSFFDRASDYRDEVGESQEASWWHVVEILKLFREGDLVAQSVVEGFERDVVDRGTAESMRHLETVFGFAATAARRYRDRIEARLESEFDGTDITAPGLLQKYLDDIGEDPYAELAEQPVVMLPVRLETRFEMPEQGNEERTGDLMVRVYPDQVHVHTHEAELTDEEVTWGKNFWAYLWYACHPEYDLTKYDLTEKFAYSAEVTVPFPFGDRLKGMVDDVDPEAFPEPPPLKGQRMAQEWHTTGEVELDASDEWADDRYEAIKERAWRQVVERFGRERGAYVVHALAPAPDGRQLLAGPWAGHGRWDLSFPDVPRRPEAWTARPTAELLPDQWVVHGTWHEGDQEEDTDDSKTIHHVTVRSNAVREPLAVGPDPESVGTTGEGTGEDGDRNETVPRELRWMVDFEEAVRAGMGIRITEEDLGVEGKVPADGRFESLVVYGVKTSISGDESVDALRNTLDAHRHTQGLEFLEPGTPTNNADVESGYSSDEDPAESMDVEIGEPLVEDGDYSDGDVLARALGIDPDDGEVHPFAHVENADMTTDREARHMNNAMWPATLGYYLKHLLVGNRWWDKRSIWASDEDVRVEPEPDEGDRAAEMRKGLAWLDAYRRHFVKYVRGDGPFPALRVGNQPYGVLPATPQSTQLDSEGFVASFDPKLISAVTAQDGDDGGDVQVGTAAASSVMAEESSTPTYNLGGEYVGGFDEEESASTARGPGAQADSVADTTSGTDSVADTTPETDSVADTTSDATPETRDGGSEPPEALADGTGEFVPRELDRVDEELPGHLRKWVDRFSGVWRDAVDPETRRLVGEGESATERPAVPRLGDADPVDDDTLLDILEMESTAGDYLRRAVFGDVNTLATVFVENNPDISAEEIRRLLEEADPELLGEETDPYKSEAELEDEISEYHARGDAETVQTKLMGALLGVSYGQADAVSGTLDRYDMTELDPVVAHLVYSSVFPDEWSYRTIEKLVDDGIEGNAQLLTNVSYDELVTIGYGFDPGRLDLDLREPADDSEDGSRGFTDDDYQVVRDASDLGPDEKRAIIDKMRLIDTYRPTLPGEPILQKSLLRVLLRFGTMQEFVTGRIKLGALYDDPVSVGPDPETALEDGADEEYRTWDDELYRYIPEELAAYPGFGYSPHAPPRESEATDTYAEALEEFRHPDAANSPVPSFGGFTFSVDQVSSYAVDRLETLLTQTLDLASYRLDAWWTSMGTRRLFELRAAQGNWRDSHRAMGTSEPKARTSVDTGGVRVEGRQTTAGADGEPEPDGGSVAGSDEQGEYLQRGAGQATDDRTAAQRDATEAVGDAVSEADLIGPAQLAAPQSESDWWTGDHIEPVDDDPAVYIGAYAFGEDLVPDETPTDAEYLHAPSLQQATTAALLRSGHQSHQGTRDELAEMLSVDLSAERVRLARSLLEGVRNGQSLGALLGYRFERALHDHDDGLQEYIGQFRTVAPAVSGKLKHDVEGEAADIGEAAAKSDVVDGYRLYRMWKGRDDEEIPWSEFEDASKGDFDEPFDHLENAIDALRDLFTAESVHQLAQGNVDRASGSVDKLADGKLPPEPEVIKTPRSSVGVTHRNLVLFGDSDEATADSTWDETTTVTALEYPDVSEPSDGDTPGELPGMSDGVLEPPDVPEPSDIDTSGGLPGTADWTLQVRPDAEPVLNRWLEELFPEPDAISCTAESRWTETRVVDTDEEGNPVEEEVDHTETHEPTLADLELSPLDALYLTQVDERPGESQLERRFAYHLRRDSERPDATVDLRFRTAASGDHVSVAEFIELARSVRSLVLDGRAARGDDLGHPADDPSKGYTDEAHAELRKRAEGVETTLGRVRYELWNRATLLDPPDGGSNLPARVDEAVTAVETFDEAVPMGRLADAADEAEAAPPNAVLDELDAIEDVLPAGPTSTADVAAEHTAVPGESLVISGTVEPYHGSDFATGTVRTPASSGTLTVDDVGFEPDVIVLTASSAVSGLEPSSGDLPVGWSHGVATLDDGTIDQRALWYGPRVTTPEGDTSRDRIYDPDSGLEMRSIARDTTDTAAGAVRAGTAVHIGPTGENDALVSGTVTSATDDGFVLDVEVDAGGGIPPRYVLEYTAMRLPSGSAVEVGQFRTPETAGEQSVALGIDANYASLSASTLGETVDGSVSTGLPVCRSLGTVAGRDAADQYVASTVTNPESTDARPSGYDNSKAGQAIRLRYPLGETNATVTDLGTSIDLEWTDVHTRKESMPGSSARKLVTYVAVETSGTQVPEIGTERISLSPALGTGRTSPGGSGLDTDRPSTRSVGVTTGFRPGLLRFTGVAVLDYDDPTPGNLGDAVAWSHGSASGSETMNVLGHSWIQGGRDSRVSYGADDQVAAVVATDRDDGSIESLVARVRDVTDDGFELEVEGALPAFGELVLFYEAWPDLSTGPSDASSDTGLPAEIELRTWSRSITGSFERTATADVAADGRFEAEMRFDDVDADPGLPFEVVGVESTGDGDGDVVYSARGRFVGEGPDPETLTAAFDDGTIDAGADTSAVAPLLDIARDRSKLSPADDGPAGRLQGALDAVTWSDGPPPTVDGEIDLQERLWDHGLLSVESDPGDLRTPFLGLGSVDLSRLSTTLDDALAPLERLGLTDLLSVTRPAEGERRLYRGSDRAAGEVRERLVSVGRDPSVLSEAVIEALSGEVHATLLSFDPRVTSYIVALSDPEADPAATLWPDLGGDPAAVDPTADPAAVARYLTMLLEHPAWFPSYLDEHEAFDGDADQLLRNLATVLYHPRTFLAESGRELADVEEQLKALIEAAPELDRLDDLFARLEPDEEPIDHRADLRENLGRFATNVTELGPFDSAGSIPGYADALETAALKLGDTTRELGAVLDADEPGRAFRGGVLDSVRVALLRASYFGVYGSVPSSAAGADPADEDALAAQARSVADRIEERTEAASEAGTAAQTAAEADEYERAVQARVEQLRAVFGDTFTVLPPFEPPNRARLAESFDSDLLGAATVDGATPGSETLEAEPLAPETWLQQVAQVRDRPATFREALSYAEALNGTLLRDLSVAQLPAADGPWVGRDGVTPEPGQVSIVAQAATGFDAGTIRDGAGAGDSPGSSPSLVTGLFVDEWLERVPERNETTGVALNYDDPGNRAPQSILLATPPESGGWTERTLRTVVSETLGLAKLRMVDLEALANVEQGEGIDLLLPALWFPRVFDHPPKDPSVDFETLERLFDPGPGAQEWWMKQTLNMDLSSDGEDGSDGSDGGDGG